MILEYLESNKLGLLKPGMTRDEVRKIFNSQVYEYKKTPLCEITADAFYKLDIHAHYDPISKKLEGVEIYQPNRLIYKDIPLLERDLKYLIIQLNKKKISYERDCIGVDLEKGKLSVYVPHDEDYEPECASVYVDLSNEGSIAINEK